MVRLNEERETLVQAVERSLRDAARTSTLRDPEIPVNAASVWDLLSGTRLFSDDLRLLMPVLVFDQFEEVFTLRDDVFRKTCAHEIGEVSHGRRASGDTSEPAPDVKVIISLREEYLGALEEMAADIPDLFRERLRVSPLTPDEARDAIIEPARLDDDFESPKFSFDKPCVDALIEFIDGVSDRVHVIEPLTLQLVCQRAEAIAIERAKTAPEPELRLADFGGVSGLDEVVHSYYTTELAKLPDPARRRATTLFEQGLLDPTGKRLMLEEDEIERRYGLDATVLRSLVDSRLLRREPRNESVFYEISHDRLTEVIARHRKTHLPRWVGVSLVTAAIVIALLGVALVYVLHLKSVATEAQHKTASALHMLFGDALVMRLKEAGLSDALGQVLHESPEVADALADALQHRRAGELALERSTVSNAEHQFALALQAIDSVIASGRQSPAINAERAQVLKDQGDVFHDKGNFPAAQSHYADAVAAWDAVLAQDPRDE